VVGDMEAILGLRRIGDILKPVDVLTEQKSSGLAEAFFETGRVLFVC